MSQSPKESYQKRLDSGELYADPVQEKAVQELERLYQELLTYKPKRNWFSRRAEAPPGIYFYGGVGRGKSMLMDLFITCLPESVPVQRVHFHEFMISVHDYMHERRSDESIRQGADESLPLFAARISEKYRVLCFDEFHVVDIADAMILARLYRNLFEHGVVIVSTSNWEPDRLYEGGLQRDLFLPCIDLIKNKMNVFHLDSPNDYRTQFLMEEGSYFYPLNKDTQERIDSVFRHLTGGVELYSETLNVKGRKIDVAQTANGVARFMFKELCEKPLGAEDYIKISDTYCCVFLDGVRKLTKRDRNALKRLMNMIDVFYENNTRVVIRADVPPDQLYSGDDHAFEFERTISRLQEMQSADYLQKAGAYA